MVQTPAQRRANARFHAREEQKMGTYRAPKADRDERRKMDMDRKFKNPTVSRWWIYGLLFLLVGGALLELARLFFS